MFPYDFNFSLSLLFFKGISQKSQIKSIFSESFLISRSIVSALVTLLSDICFSELLNVSEYIHRNKLNRFLNISL